MSRPIKTRVVFDLISTGETLLTSSINEDLALQQQICALHPHIFSKYSLNVSDNNIREHQISLDLCDSEPDTWRDR